jgi:hypothetical protein
MPDVEPVDNLGAAVLGLAAAGISHPLLIGWVQTPNATFGGRRPADAWREHPRVVEDIARLAIRDNFREPHQR